MKSTGPSCARRAPTGSVGVRIASGPFDGYITRILELDERHRLVVLLDVIHRGIKIRINSEMVTPA
jgi:transcription antitermination factor NusG